MNISYRGAYCVVDRRSAFLCYDAANGNQGGIHERRTLSRGWVCDVVLTLRSRSGSSIYVEGKTAIEPADRRCLRDVSPFDAFTLMPLMAFV